MNYFQTNMQTIATNKNKDKTVHNFLRLVLVYTLSATCCVSLHGKVTQSTSDGCSARFSFVICKIRATYLSAPFDSIVQNIIPVILKTLDKHNKGDDFIYYLIGRKISSSLKRKCK